MATYTVKAPDGKTITLQGPDGASQADIVAQAQKLYKPQAAAPAGNIYLQKYNSIRNGLAAGEPDETRRQIALTRFDSDPRAQQLRKMAGLAPLSTAQGDVQAVARKSMAQRVTDAGADVGKNATSTQSASAGISRGMFGIPEILAAAGERFLPSAITGNNTDASYSNILQMIRAKDTAAINANPGAGLAGEVGGSIVGGGAAGRVAMGGASRLAATGVPGIARAAQAVESLGTLRKGAKLANTGKIIATGAAAGGAQAAGTGEDVPTGIEEGAIAAPLVATGFKAAQVVTRPFRDVLRLSSAEAILSRLTTATRDQLEAKAASYRAATGAEPTLFELLPLADRNKILKQAVVGKDNIVEQTSDAIRSRAQNLGPEMSARAQQILTPQRTFIQNGIRNDIAQARGGQLAPGDDEMIANAMESPTDMLHLRDEEARAIMAPHEATPVAGNLEDLFPQVPGPNGTAVGTDPEVQNVIRNAAGLIRQRNAGAGISAGDITDMISKLRPMLGQGGNDAMVAERAINHLHDVLDSQAPEAGSAARQMSDAYAARSRMAEGMGAGATTQLRDDVQVGTSRRQARTVRNAYDTAEGAGGRSLGQGNRVLSDLGGSPEEALRATVKQSRGSTGRQLEQNIGGPEADQLVTAARAQDESAQALASASAKAQSGSGEGADAEMLVQAIAGLHPSSFITTKAGAVRKLLDMTYIPENRARTIVDMIFSQDPTMRERALRAVGNQPNGATFLKYLAGTTGQLTEEANAPDPTQQPQEPAATDIVPVTSQEVPAEDPNDPSTWEKRPDGSTKGTGFLGVMHRPDGSVSSEISVGLPINGKEMDVPTMVPGLTHAELDWLLRTPVERIAKELPDSIRQKAIAHAQQRIAAGQSPFLEPGENAAPDQAGGQSPYASALLSIYQNENPDLINLVQRVKHQESRGNQAAISPKGAVGIMQVMPDTGPEAAKLAGLPWDENAFHTDAAYNEILGIAYLSQLLRKYKGDVGHALAAYNAGAGNVDHALASHGENFLSALPAETQDYVSRVGG